MSTPRSPSSLSNPASAVNPVDTDTIWNIHRRLSQLRKARNTDDFPPLLDIELLVGLAEAFLNAPSDSSLKSRFWAELLPKVDAALTKAFERSRSLLSPGASDEFVKIPTDIKGWIEEVVPIHVELIKDIVQQGRGKEAVLELLPVLQELKNVKDIPPENQDTLSDLVLALDRLLKSESQELSGDDYVIPPEENFMRILGVNNSDELRQLCEASGIFEYTSYNSEDMSQDDSDNRSILRRGGLYAAPPAPAAVPLSPPGTSAAAASAWPPVPRAPVPVAPGDGTMDMSVETNPATTYTDDSNMSLESTASTGTPAHSEVYEGTMDMSLASRSAAISVSEFDLSLDPRLDDTPAASPTPPSPGLRERTNMPPPSPRGRTAKGKEGVDPRTPSVSASGRESPVSSAGSQKSRSGSRTRAVRAPRGWGATPPLMHSTPAGLGAHPSQKGPGLMRTPSGLSHASSDASWPDFQKLRDTEDALAKERDEHEKSRQELARERQEREKREMEVKSLQAAVEKEKDERAKEVRSLQASIEKEADFFKALLQEKDKILQEKDKLIQEKDKLIQKEEERRESELNKLEGQVGLYKDMLALLKDQLKTAQKVQ
ncbi:uncharacterized protein TRAVEDRAFT_54424 [Trametes versicolor FP-101664 SS1]|uniref:Uncharacterized protein n=1 Tax=Trametes versicolor (strain FP-101664) TaxID=717944 RepID=R7S6Y1_TRAVS|nr:uncharacterized protein TRAVEDRAFT_54424 [Trametes versicolor FP-101664 SS1]EIW51671.1 hypothetical protein TRAVEDRAFT_54424 [Trametes versicolor FP-101664 SS1]